MRLVTVCLLLLPFFPTGAAKAADVPVDVALVLAVDVSHSMDPDEQQLQRQGYAAGLRSPEVIAAIKSGIRGRIAVTYVEWSGPDSQAVVIPWTLIDGAAGADAVADEIMAKPAGRGFRTSISSALSFSAGLFVENGFDAERQTIDVSGDGPNNAGEPVTSVRDRVVARGIIINGLPIMLKRGDLDPFGIKNLDAYYRDCVIGGSDSFMIPIKAVGQFEEAIRRKLVLEIAWNSPRVMKVADTEPAVETDCMAGEKLRGGSYFH